MRILEILAEFLKEVEKDNPFNLVLKGGTALSLYHLDHHRESEDLDFDAEKHFLKDYQKIETYLTNVLEKLKQREIITEYKITKTGFASTERYHIKIELKTHKTYSTKIDLEFIDLPKNLVKNGKLNLYSKERMFITKLVTFISRKEFKDLYDISHLSEKIDLAQFKEKENTIKLIQEAINVIQQEDIQKMFKLAFRNIDLKFKNLKEPHLKKFTEETISKLRRTINKLNKG
ncbi:nucleotidyl transferase AbiEii/AbiGii toxin family protein [Candidatus Woesearchaeota archaeon]|nr:nucleotidyl transferase AbiEii/AbiGii toxin family protein [Candidatus Woesearchaeota archaeon]